MRNEEQLHHDYHHRFGIYDWRVSTRSMFSDEQANSQVPHSLVIIFDTITPPDHRLLRSEVLLAAMILREGIAQQHWTGHHTLPVGASTKL